MVLRPGRDTGDGGGGAAAMLDVHLRRNGDAFGGGVM